MFPLNHPQKIYLFKFNSHKKSVGNVDWIPAVIVGTTPVGGGADLIWPSY
jgi:hypothetical protein